ncbi:VIT1/CCC1 transporter family protein [Candidatus Aenigmatarchaeota archaeon]
MPVQRKKRKMSYEEHKEDHKTGRGVTLRDMILGGQDGLVNVLGIILGVAAATVDVRIVIIAGLVATFAESISMAAVAYTSTKAQKDFYKSELHRERTEMEEVPHFEKREIREIYHQKGFRGKLLSQVVNKITSNKRVWLETMMHEELHLFPDDYDKPLRSAVLVGISAILGSLVPLIPFFVGIPVFMSMIASVVLSIIVLFGVGYAKAKLTIGSAGKSGIEMALVGILSAIAGYVVGTILVGIL